MGNGPGGLQEYQDLFTRHDRCLGGFVWEWIDHTIAMRTSDGEPWFAYGGDFGEPVHDGNFVADGLLFGDRTPSPGLLELAKVIEPVKVVVSDGDVRLTNTYTVLDTSHLDVVMTVEDDGVQAAREPLSVPLLAPGESALVPLPALPPGPRQGERWVTVAASLRESTPWAPAGHVVGWGQCEVAAAADRLPSTSEHRRPACSTIARAAPSGLAISIWAFPSSTCGGRPRTTTTATGSPTAPRRWPRRGGGSGSTA